MKKEYTSPDMTFLIWGNKDDICAGGNAKILYLTNNTPPTAGFDVVSTGGGDSNDLFQ